MKTIILGLMMLPLISMAQKEDNIFPEVDGVPSYTEVVKVDSTLKKDILYLNAKKWFVDYYKSAKDVIQLEDKENGIIIGKGIFTEIIKFNFIATYDAKVSHTVKITVKDGRYKYEISGFSAEYYRPGSHNGGFSVSSGYFKIDVDNSVPNKGNKNKIYSFRKDCNSRFLLIIQDLKAAMINNNKADNF